ncbi:rod shape-determining protein [Streptacidiphilus monticola]|uniref:Cell shape-determining protein MreB n=1 Tax=Streptacidiphilus monticola TaxID=2161674 RepID=A0ABW1FZ95_9ACTN
MLRRLNPIGPDLGVDFGSSRLRVFAPGKGIIVDVANTVVVDTRHERVVAYGDAALGMHGRTPPGVVTVEPVRAGEVADFDTARWLLARVLRESGAAGRLARPRIAVCIPQEATDVTRRALAETCWQSGARDVRYVDAAWAASVGTGLPASEPRGSMVADIGVDSTRTAVLVLGEIVTAELVRSGGSAFELALVEYLRHGRELQLSRAAAELLKMRVGVAPTPDARVQEEVLVAGRGMRNGLPESQRVPIAELHAAMEKPLRGVVDAMAHAVASSPPELCEDLRDRGIVLTGRGAQLSGLVGRASQALGLPVHLSDDPGSAAAEGAARLARAPRPAIHRPVPQTRVPA